MAYISYEVNGPQSQVPQVQGPQPSTRNYQYETDANGYPTTASVFRSIRAMQDSGNQEGVNSMINLYTQSISTPGSPYYKPYYTNYTPDQQYESATIDMENDLQQMYRDVQVAVAKGYSDAWITNNITASNYKNIEKARKAALNGEPSKFTRQVGYLGDDTIYGMIYAARNGDDYSGDMLSSVARYYMGYGKQYADDDKAELRDRTSEKWNPYAFGGASASTEMNKYCSKYGMVAFTDEWVKQNADELERNGDLDKIKSIVADTQTAESEYERLQKTALDRLRNGESVEDIYNRYFGDGMKYLKDGNDLTEAGYSTLAKMEEKRQLQSAYNLAWEVPFASYSFKDWLQNEAAPQVKQEKAQAAYDQFMDTVPRDYQGAILALYARENGYKSDHQFTDEDLPAINAWIEKNDLGKTSTNPDEQGSYEQRILRFTNEQTRYMADNVEPTPNFTATEFLEKINAKDKNGAPTAEAADTNADFRLGIEDFLSGKPITDPNVKAFVEKYGQMLDFYDPSKARSINVGDKFGAGIEMVYNYALAVDEGVRKNMGMKPREDDSTDASRQLLGDVYSAQLKEFSDLWQKGAISDSEYTDLLLRIGSDVDAWMSTEQYQTALASDTLDNMSLTFPAYMQQTGRLMEDLNYFSNLKATSVRAYNNRQQQAKVDTAVHGYDIIKRVNSGEKLEDIQDTNTYQKIQQQDIRNAVNTDFGYRDALDKMSTYGAEYLNNGATNISAGSNYEERMRQNENDFICMMAGSAVDELMKVAQASGVSFTDFCASANIDVDSFVQDAYAKAYTDYQNAVDVGVQVAKSFNNFDPAALNDAYNSLGIEGGANATEQTALLERMRDEGWITQEQFDDYERIYGAQDDDSDKASEEDVLLMLGARDVLNGGGSFIEGEDRNAIARRLISAQTGIGGNDRRNITGEQREAYQSGAGYMEQLVATGESNNVGTILKNGAWKGTLTFSDSWVVSSMGWLGHDREEIEAAARQNFSREEYRDMIEQTVTKLVDDENLRNAYLVQLQEYKGDIYKFDFDNRTINFQDAHARLSEKMEAVDAEMREVLTPEAYKWYGYTAMATNSIELSVPTMIVSWVTGGAAVPTLISQLATTGYVEGGQTAYELQQAGVNASASKGGGFLVGVLTALSEWGLDGLVNKLTYKSGLVKTIENATDFNPASLGLKLSAMANDAGMTGLAPFAKLAGNIFGGTAMLAKDAFIGSIGESVQEVQQDMTADLIKTMYGQSMQKLRDYGKTFTDSYFSGLIQTVLTGGFATAVKTAQASQANTALVNDITNQMLGAALTQEGAAANQQREIGAIEQKIADVQSEIAEVAAERESEVEMMKNAESEARVQIATVDFSVEAAIALHNSELVGDINATVQENAQITEMLSNLEQSIDDASDVFAQAQQEIETSEMPTSEMLDRFSNSQKTLNGLMSERTNLEQRLKENGAKVAALQEQRKAQAQAAVKEAQAKAFQVELDRRMEEARQQAAKRQADLETLEKAYEDELAQAQADLDAMNQGYEDVLNRVEQGASESIDRLNEQAEANDKQPMLSKQAIAAAKSIFNVLSEGGQAAAKIQAQLKQGLIHTMELSFPGFNVRLEDLGADTDAAVVVDDNATGDIVVNTRASVPALMSGILAHELSHIAEASESFSKYYQSVTQAVYGTRENIRNAFDKVVERLHKSNPELSDNIRDANNIFFRAQKELAAECMAKILGAVNTVETQGDYSVFSMNWIKAIKKGDPFLGKSIQEWLKIRADELVKFTKTKAVKQNKEQYKAIKEQYNRFAQVVNDLYDALSDVGEQQNTTTQEQRNKFIGNQNDYNLRIAPEQTRQAQQTEQTEQQEAPAEQAPVQQEAENPYADFTDENGNVRFEYTEGEEQDRVLTNIVEDEEEAPYAEFIEDEEQPNMTEDQRLEAELFEGWINEQREKIQERSQQIEEQTQNWRKARSQKAKQTIQKAIDKLTKANDKSMALIDEWTNYLAEQREIAQAELDRQAAIPQGEAQATTGSAPQAGVEQATQYADENQSKGELRTLPEQRVVAQQEQQTEAEVSTDTIVDEEGNDISPDALAEQVAEVLTESETPAQGEDIEQSVQELATEQAEPTAEQTEEQTEVATEEQPAPDRIAELKREIGALQARVRTMSSRIANESKKLNKFAEGTAKNSVQRTIDGYRAIKEQAKERIAQLNADLKAAQDAQNAEQSSGFSKKFDQAWLAQALQTKLNDALAANDEAGYRKIASKIMGIVKNMRKAGPLTNTPIRTMLDLGQRIGANIYQNVAMRKQHQGEVIQDLFKRNIMTDRVTADNFIDTADAVGDRVSEQFNFTDADTGDPDLSFHDFWIQYLTHSDSAIANNPILQQALDNFNQHLEAGDKNMADFVRLAREQMVNFVNGEQIARLRSMVITSMERSQRNQSGDGTWRQRIHDALEWAFDDSLATYAQNMAAGNNDLQRMGLYRPYAMRTVNRLFTGDYVKGLNNKIDPNIQTWSKLTEDHKITTDMQGVLDTYLTAMTAIDRAEAGEEAFDPGATIAGINGFEIAPTVDNLRQVVQDIETHFPNIKAFADDWYKSWQNFMQEYVVNSGQMTQEKWDELKAKNPHYAPLFRDMSSLDNINGFKRAYAQKEQDGTVIRLKQYKGHSNRQVLSPTESFMNLAEHIVATAYNNEMAKTFENNYNANPDVMSELATRLDGYAAINPVLSAEAPDVLTVVHDDGSRSYYKFKDMDLLGYIKGTNNKYQVSSMLKATGALTRFMSTWTTARNVFFSVRNLIRDFQHSVNYGTWASNYLTGAVKWIAAMTDVAGKHHSEQYNDYIALGGGEWERMDVRRKNTASRLRNEMFIPTPGAKIRNKIGKIITFETINNIIETTSRFAEYKYGENNVGTTSRLGNRKGRQGVSTEESRQQAFMNAQEATVDFQRHGAGRFIQDIRKVVPFLNPTLQGFYQDVRLLGNMDTYTSEQRAKRGRTIAKVVINNIALGFASAASFLLNPALPDEDKKVYLDMNKSMKYSYILFPGRWVSRQLFGDSFAVALYGGRGEGRLSLTQGSFERIVYASTIDLVEAIYRGEDVGDVTTGLLEDVIGATWSALKEPFNATTIVSPIIGVLRNRNYHGSEIVSKSRYNSTSDVTQYYTGTTPTIFRALSKVFAKMGVNSNLTSPQGMQYLAEQYTGVIGQLLIPAMSGDKYGGGTNPLKNIAYSVPNQVRKTFTIDADTISETDDAFYSMVQELTDIKNSASRGYDIPEVLNASLSDEQIKQAAQYAKDALSTDGIVGDAQSRLYGYYDEIKAIMAGANVNGIDYSTRTQPEREMAVEQVYRTKVRPLQKEALRWYADFQNEYCGGRDFFSEIDSIYSDRTVGAMSTAESNRWGVMQTYGSSVSQGYTDEVQRLADWYDAQPDEYKKQHTKNITSKVYATPNTSFTKNKVQYKFAEYDGATDDVKTWYGEYYWPEYDSLVASYEYRQADEEGKINLLSKLDSNANAYAQAKFLEKLNANGYITQP